MRALNTALTLLALLLLASVVAHASDGPGLQIVGGGDVPDPNPYTYQVSVGTTDSTFCGGSVIAATWVLSAAHCFVDEDTGAVTEVSTLVVRVGLRELSAATAADERAVARLLVHPSYDRSTSANDIALLELTTGLPTDWVVPLAGAGNDAALTVAGTIATATGWGGLKGYAPPETEPAGGQETPDILQYVEMPIVANATCQSEATQLCAGEAAGGKDTCQGDSGGPLVVGDGAGGYIQVGVVSNGAGCAAPGNYGVYTRVSSYGSWIASSLGDLNLPPQAYLPLVAR